MSNLSLILGSASGGTPLGNTPLGASPTAVATPPQTAQPTQTPTGQLDPQVVALAKAIRQTESNNNFQAKGGSGEYGAYQWEPGTWDSMSKAPSVSMAIRNVP